jgi:hypothetical protein
MFVSECVCPSTEKLGGRETLLGVTDLKHQKESGWNFSLVGATVCSVSKVYTDWKLFSEKEIIIQWLRIKTTSKHDYN